MATQKMMYFAEDGKMFHTMEEAEKHDYYLTWIKFCKKNHIGDLDSSDIDMIYDLRKEIIEFFSKEKTK